jgi:hypothetical protein
MMEIIFIENTTTVIMRKSEKEMIVLNWGLEITNFVKFK